MRTIVDPKPLDRGEELRNALIAGKVVYRMVSERKLQRIAPINIGTAGPLLADHRCGPGLVGAAKVEIPAEDPQSAPVQPGRQPDGYRPPPAPAGAQTSAQGLSSGTSSPPKAAAPASHHRSDVEGEPWDYANAHGTSRNEPNGSAPSAEPIYGTVRLAPSPVAGSVCSDALDASIATTTPASGATGASWPATNGSAASAENSSPMTSTGNIPSPQPWTISTRRPRVVETATTTCRQHTGAVTRSRATPDAPEYVNRRCPGCFELIGTDRNIIGAQLGDRWMWVQHDSC